MRINNFIILLLFIFISGCVGTNGTTQAPSTGDAEVATQRIPIPSNCPFAKIKKNMGLKQVTDIIGQPNDQEAYATGKAFIPFYMGSDISQLVYYYKGLGKIYFAGGGPFGGSGRVIDIVYDPSEDGYR